MLKKIFSQILLLSVFLFIGCTSLPLNTNSTILVGFIKYKGDWHYKGFPKSLLNSERQDGINFLIENTKSKKFYILVTNKDGFIFDSNIEPGQYRLISLEIVVSNFIGKEKDFKTVSPDEKLELTIIPAKVNNFGQIVFTDKPPKKTVISFEANYDMVFNYAKANKSYLTKEEFSWQDQKIEYRK